MAEKSEWRSYLSDKERENSIGKIYDKLVEWSGVLDTDLQRRMSKEGAEMYEANVYKSARSMEDYHSIIEDNWSSFSKVGCAGVPESSQRQEQQQQSPMHPSNVNPQEEAVHFETFLEDENSLQCEIPITPIERLARAVERVPREILLSAVSDMLSVTMDKGPEPLPGSREYKKRRFIETMDRISEEEGGLSAKRMTTRPSMLEEIKEINQKLMETVAEIYEDENKLTMLKLTYTPVGEKNKQYSWSERLHIPEVYPECLPKLVENLSVDETNVCADLSGRTRFKFSTYLDTLSQPMSLKDVIQAWNDCARAEFIDYAQRCGGGSAFGSWKKFPFA